MGRKQLRRFRRPLEALLILAVLFFLGRHVYFRWQEVQAIEFRLSLELVGAASLMLVLFYIAFSATWQRILRMIAAYPPGCTRTSLHRAFIMAFLARYLPGGNVMTVGGRVELFNRLGGSRSLGLESVYYEQLYLTVGAVILGLLAAPTLPWGLLPSWAAAQASLLIVVVAVGTALVALGPELAVRLVVRLLGKASLEKLGTQLKWQHKVELVFRFLLINLLQGAVAYGFLLAVFPNVPMTASALLQIIAAYPLARFLGQLVAFVPGGLGVREGAYTLLLDPLLPIQPIIVTAALVRLASVAVELMLAGGVVALDQAKTSREGAAWLQGPVSEGQDELFDGAASDSRADKPSLE